MWYAAAAGWLALCGLAFIVHRRIKWKDAATAVVAALILSLAFAIIIGLMLLAGFLFLAVPQMIFGPVGGLVGAGIGFWLIFSVVLTDAGDSWLDGLKLSTAVMVVMVPLLILLGKAG